MNSAERRLAPARYARPAAETRLVFAAAGAGPGAGPGVGPGAGPCVVGAERDGRALSVCGGARASGAEWQVGAIGELAQAAAIRPGDVVVLNDSATLPASLRASDGAEVRLMGRVHDSPDEWHALLLGTGDWRTATERRPFAPALTVGARLRFARREAERLLGGTADQFNRLEAEVTAVSDVSDAWIKLRFDRAPDSASLALAAFAKPIQYSHLAGEAPLYQVQTPVAARPWSVEMPSAARPLSWDVLERLRHAGAMLATLTHGCGISSSGDPRIDRCLPLEEEYEIPPETASAVNRARRVGGRVIAIGTSVVRALESAVDPERGLVLSGRRWTKLRIGPDTRLCAVDGILTGLHEPGESHFELLRAFTARERLVDALGVAHAHGLLSHELGDALLVLRERGPREQAPRNHQK